jgi:magnesium transporter
MAEQKGPGANGSQPQPDKIYFLSEILEIPVYANGKRIGKLSDVIIEEKGTIPHVMKIVVARKYGNPALIVPIDKIAAIYEGHVDLSIESMTPYEASPRETDILLKDFVIDKKVIDVEGREVAVVYDAKIIQIRNKLYVSDVDFSKYGLFRRMHLKWLADLLKIREHTVFWGYIQALPSRIGSFKGDVSLKILKAKLPDISPVDFADILEELDREQRAMLFGELVDKEYAADTLEELDPSFQRDIVSSMNSESAAELVGNMTPGQAADLLSVVPFSEKNRILALLDREFADKIRAILDQQEEAILNFTSRKYLAFAPSETAASVLEKYERTARKKDVIMYLYVLDENRRLLGVVDIKEVLLSEKTSLLRDIMTDTVISLSPENTLKEASQIFKKYWFRALPILDKNGKMLGVVPFKDVINLKHRFL